MRISLVKNVFLVGLLMLYVSEANSGLLGSTYGFISGLTTSILGIPTRLLAKQPAKSSAPATTAATTVSTSTATTATTTPSPAVVQDYSTCGILQRYGYDCESHKVTTDDGYILTMFRVLCPKANIPETTSKPVAFLMHGLLASSTIWTLTPEFSLAMTMCDQGYDVWLGNARGNEYSSEHVVLNTSSPNFYMFSWAEIAAIDLPAMMRYALTYTKQDKLSYVGHSQGTTVFFALASSDPTLAESLISSAHLLAPIAFTTNWGGLLSEFTPLLGVPDANSSFVEVELSANILPLVDNLKGQTFCADIVAPQRVCIEIYDMIFGVSAIANQEASTTQLSRLDGVSRIPLPRSQRAPSASTNIARVESKIGRPTLSNNKRTILFGASRYPTSKEMNTLKKSKSGEILSYPINAVSKKSTTALNKFLGKAEKSPFINKQSQTRKPSQLNENKRLNAVAPPKFMDPQIQNINETVTLDSKTNTETKSQLFTRSSTFVRGDNNIEFTALVQSTPASRLTPNSTPYFETPGMSDVTTTILPNLSETVTIKNAQYDGNITKSMGQAHNSTHVVNSTMYFVSPDQEQFKNIKPPLGHCDSLVFGKTLTLTPKNLSNALNSTEIVDRSKRLMETPFVNENESKSTNMSPIANVTYCNAGPNHNFNTDATYCNTSPKANLTNLEDVSMPSELDDKDTTLLGGNISIKDDIINEPLAKTPNKKQMQLQLSSTINTDRLLDFTQNMTNDFMCSPRSGIPTKNTSKLLYMSHLSNATTPDRLQKSAKIGTMPRPVSGYRNTPLPVSLLSPMLLKGAQSDLVLPTRTPDDDDDDDRQVEPMNVDSTLCNLAARTEEFYNAQVQHKKCSAQAMSLQDINNPHENQKARFSFGLDLTESTLDCSIELIDISISSTGLSQPNCAMNSASRNSSHHNNFAKSPSCQQLHQPHQQTQLQQQQHQNQIHQYLLKKQNSFEMDESLGILTPDQMKEFLDSNATNNMNNLDLPLDINNSNNHDNKITFHQLRMEQTPSPEELPLDPVEVKTDISDFLSQQQQTLNVLQQKHLMAQQQTHQDSISQQTETELSKTDQMVKSNVSKISTSFITSVTSVTSLDTGYQGDGEMSRPASRGASDHSPSNGPIPRKVGPVSRQPSFNQVHAMPPTIRRQDLMTDSDFFTESDADELHHRGGDRRAQVIDGQLYGPTGASLFISEDPQMEDSCMESSGIFTDVENRCEEDLAVMRRSQQATQELSPDGEADDSTETVKSYRAKQLRALADSVYEQANSTLGQGQNADRKPNSQTSPMMLSSYSNERLSADTTLSNRTSYCSMDGASSAVHINGDCKSYCSLEETAFNENYAKTKQSTKSVTTTGTKSLCGDHMHASTPATVDISISPRKHASLTSLSNENALIAYVANKSAIKSASGTDISPHVKGSCVDSQTVSVNGSGSSSRTSLLSETCDKSITTRTPKLVNKSVKNLITTTPKSSKNVSSTRKSHVPNKWDAVMNKIATNKATQVRKNYNDVKSKVSTRNILAITGVNSSGVSVDGSSPASSVASPRIRRSPTSTSSNVLKVLQSNSPKLSESNLSGKGSQTITSQRPLLQSATKRVRSYSSKDSPKSDLSPGSGSPKLLAKTLIRAAKKRDVRNLSISPTDLGPPPKTQQTTNGTVTRTKTSVTAPHLPKRVTVSPPTNTQICTASNPPSDGALSKNTNVENIKSSQIYKNQNNNLRQTSTFKDQNRLLGSTQSINSASTIIKNVSKVSAVGQLHDHNVNNNNNSNVNNNHNVQTATVLLDKLRTSSQRSSPILGQQQQQQNAKKTVATTAGAAATEKKIQMKLPVTRKCNLQKPNGVITPTEAKKISTTTPTTPTTNGGGNSYLSADEIQRLKYLNRHSFNGLRDYELLKLHLKSVEEAKEHQEKGVLALGLLVKYMVCELDAFACPATKVENEKFKLKIQKVLTQLQDAQNEYLELQNQLCDKETYYATREEELQTLHRCELEKFRENALKYEEMSEKRISELEAKLVAKDEQQKSTMSDYQFEMQLKFSEKEQQLLAAEQRLKVLTEEQKNLTERLEIAERDHRQEMTAAIERELAQNERIDQLKKELDILRESKQHRERELRDKLNLSQDEIALLRCSPTNNGDGAPAMRHSSASCGSTPKSTVPHNELNRLQSEAESLRCVLEIKQKEVSKLNKQNEELMRDAEECSVLRSKIYSLETTKEMLQSEVKIKTVKEKEYLRQINDMQKNLKHETQKHTRLLYDNEALTWQLKQRSELLHHLEIKLQETLKDSNFNFDMFSLVGKSSLHQKSTSASENSPPPSPITKGVIEKNNSVAWVLEMDDETPEEAATKLVRRVGSFRSPIQKASMSSCSANDNCSSGSANKSSGPNRLSQSMSATSVIRKHSNESTKNQKVRTRSYSVSGDNSSESTGEVTKPNKNGKKIARQNTVGPSQYLELTSAIDRPLSTSSPYANMRPRSSTLIAEKNTSDAMSILQNKTNKALATHRKLITCDTSTLNSGERLKLRALPKSAVHGLKSRKKCLEIQESAGEAMVSGANSEDEGCSASSDEIASSVSMGSATSSSSTSLNQLKNSNMSLEEILLMENINNLSSTPMECSWSDDAEIYVVNHKV